MQEYMGKGIGNELMKRSIQEARERDFDCLWLGVWKKNERAISFYEKWGFEHVGDHTFILGEDVQKDLTMQLNLAS